VARTGQVSNQDAEDGQEEAYQTTPYDLTRWKLRSKDRDVAGSDLIIRLQFWPQSAIEACQDHARLNRVSATSQSSGPSLL